MQVSERIQAEIEGHPVVLFMKGTPQFPMCGFSSRTVQALKHRLELGARDHLVEVVHVGLVVLAVVEVDGLAGDVRLQGGAIVGQGGQFDGHGGLLGRGRGLQWTDSTPTPAAGPRTGGAGTFQEAMPCRYPNASRPRSKAIPSCFS